MLMKLAVCILIDISRALVSCHDNDDGYDVKYGHHPWPPQAKHTKRGIANLQKWIKLSRHLPGKKNLPGLLKQKE